MPAWHGADNDWREDVAVKRYFPILSLLIAGWMLKSGFSAAADGAAWLALANGALGVLNLAIGSVGYMLVAEGRA